RRTRRKTKSTKIGKVDGIAVRVKIASYLAKNSSIIYSEFLRDLRAVLRVLRGKKKPSNALGQPIRQRRIQIGTRANFFLRFAEIIGNAEEAEAIRLQHHIARARIFVA